MSDGLPSSKYCAQNALSLSSNFTPNIDSSKDPDFKEFKDRPGCTYQQPPPGVCFRGPHAPVPCPGVVC